MDKIDIDELRQQIRNYYGAAAVVMGRDDPLMGFPAAAEVYDTDDLSDEEVLAEAKRLGLI
ncbi:MAG: hypothetical protein IIZ28_07415 [Erysipelotrichaceae bacterium]|nr:hypothetical protein [Erysipelotrichaceae bacterium]MBQ1483381.1 hypothetical protein [Erysipelotrichaceae bacterium]